jgi:hypothetical protein
MPNYRSISLSGQLNWCSYLWGFVQRNGSRCSSSSAAFSYLRARFQRRFWNCNVKLMQMLHIPTWNMVHNPRGNKQRGFSWRLNPLLGDWVNWVFSNFTVGYCMISAWPQFVIDVFGGCWMHCRIVTPRFQQPTRVALHYLRHHYAPTKHLASCTQQSLRTHKVPCMLYPAIHQLYKNQLQFQRHSAASVFVVLCCIVLIFCFFRFSIIVTEIIDVIRK